MSYQLQEINRRIDQDVKGFLEACDAQYANKVSQAADTILNNLSTSPIVLLSGPSGSGKTTTALKIEEALDHMAGPDNLCPTCGAQMTCRRWFSQPGRRYMALAQCPEHGDFLIRVRLSPETGGTFRVSRLTYQGDSEAALAYAKRAEKAESTRQTRRRRRRHPAKRATLPGNPGSMSES